MKEYKASKDCIELIIKYEGFRDRAYECAAGTWTIGYGHTAGVRPGDTTNKTLATILLKKDIENVVNRLNKYIKIDLKQNEFDAIVSLAFNIGTGAFLNSTLFKYLNAGEKEKAADEFKKWNKVKNNVLQGLVLRRAEEERLFRK